ncbi:uncharacterized protein LOC119024600 isoform X3 [Acanthopagrus latus]|uniref:uncharacterized protein LOC119024600 isoform X3 n=1 Tax=Acanthopagrus latus TaxID=8177 RepID=UPI00187CD248|nr:uncharacterized protein LOC119024600 isoform X3 [Acanthopagrus latus]
MEQDCIAGLYQSLGKSAGAEFSSEDVSLLCSKVFHVPFDTDEAHAAMRKIAGDERSWSCVGESVLDVLLEMERERDKKEKLYWDLQLLNGNLKPLHAMDESVFIVHQSSEPNPLKTAHDQSDSGPVQLHTSDTGGLQRLMENKELDGSLRAAKRLKKPARQCWARLASEGVQCMLLPSPWQARNPEVRGQAWGCVTLSDVLLLVEVKYDVVTHLLFTEMLQEHYTPSIWETMLPWQQQEEEQELEDRAKEALELSDMLCLAELPGAFRIYRAGLGVSPTGRPESREQSWTAVTLLFELDTFRQEERDALTVLGERLDRESLTLLCLYIRLATLRAQRQKMSYGALLAARQSWETWPNVKSPCGADQAALWLCGEEGEQKTDSISVSPQQAVLQLLVLTQEQERKHLIKLVHGVSLEDVQKPGCGVPPKEDSHKQAALKNGCVKRLRQIHADLRTHNETETPLKLTNPQPQHQANMWSQQQLEDCSLLLLTHLMEFQEVQASAVLPALMDKSAQRVQALREEFESQLQAQRYTNSLQLLISDACPSPNFTENSSNEQIATQSSVSGAVDAPGSSDRPAEALTVDSVSGDSQELDGVQADRQDVCTGCGATIEDLPYLEIVCVSDATSHSHQSPAAAGEAQVEEEGSAAKIPQSFEKQDSLITLAWSKPPEDDADSEEQSQGGEGCMQTEVQPTEDTFGDREDLRPTLMWSDSTGHSDPQAADQQCSTLTLEGRAVDEETEKGEATHALVVETEQLHLSADRPEINWHDGDLCDETEGEGDEVEAEMCSSSIESLTQAEDQKYAADCSPAEREAILMERERAREPVSAMERERTMRNLVDMQRKVEQRQQRDRKRQLLRVQERLSIIQNKKAEEDLLGLKHTDRLRHLTQDLPQEDKNQQKTVVKERLEQLRRERSYVMQSKRDRNTAGFKELLGPVALNSRETDEGAD